MSQSQLPTNTDNNDAFSKLLEENLSLIQNIEESKQRNIMLDKTYAILMMEQNYYLHILENISQVVKMEPKLCGVTSILYATPEELENQGKKP